MEVTLRRAARLLVAVDQKISELTSLLYDSPVKTVYVGDNPSDISQRLTDARMAGLTVWQSIRDLITVRTTLRGLVGAANAAQKVNDLVTQLKGAQMTLTTLQNLRGRAGLEPALSSRELNVRLTALKGDASKVQVAYNVRGRNEDNVPFQTYSQEDLDTFAEEDRQLRIQIDGLQDQVERINNTVMFEVPVKTVTVLKEAKVL